MNDLNALNDLLSRKIERQVMLNEKSEQLKNLDLGLSGSKFIRWFGSSYLIIKRILTLLLGLTIILVALGLIFYPKVVLNEESIKKELINSTRSYYAHMAGQTLNETLVGLTKSNSNISVNEVIIQLDLAINKSLEKEILFIVRLFGGSMLILAFFLIYISRLSRKMRTRNKNISNAQLITQEVIAGFRTVIEEEEEELVILQNMISKLIKSKN